MELILTRLSRAIRVSIQEILTMVEMLSEEEEALDARQRSSLHAIQGYANTVLGSMDAIMASCAVSREELSRMGGEDAAARGLSPPLRKIASIDGVDARLGLCRANGMQEVYVASAGILAQGLPDIVRRLEAFLAEGNLKSLAIEAHSLKGSLLHLGADGMAFAAAEFERRAGEKDARFCAARLPSLLQTLTALREGLADALTEQDAGAPRNPDGGRAVLRDRIGMVRHLLDAFERDAALDILREMTRCDYGPGINDALRDLRGRVEGFDYRQAMAMADALAAHSGGAVERQPS